MSALAARGIHSYRQTEVQSRTPLELVVMLYDGALRFATSARDAIGRGDMKARHQGITRALAIVSELQSTLDMESGGELSAELDRLYVYVRDRLVDASVQKNDKALDDVLRVLQTLRAGWVEISHASQARAATR